MAFVLGLDAKTYENQAYAALTDEQRKDTSQGGPVDLALQEPFSTDPSSGTAGWGERRNIQDSTINLEAATADVSTRGGGGFRQVVGTLKEGSIDFSMIYDTSDPLFVTLFQAFDNNWLTHMIWADGDMNMGGVTPEGITYFEAEFAVLNFTWNASLEEAMTVDVTLQSGFSTLTIPAIKTTEAPPA